MRQSAYSNSDHQWAKGFLRSHLMGGRNTPQWHTAEGMRHHVMDTREGHLQPLGSPAETINFEGEEPGQGNQTQARRPSGMMGHLRQHGWGAVRP